MAGYSRSAPPTQTSGNSFGGRVGGITTTNGSPRVNENGGLKSNLNQSNPGSGGSASQSGSSNTSSSTTGTRNTRTTGTQTTNTNNMDDQSFQALQDLIANLAAGGSEKDQARWEQIQSEIAANQQQRETYSKEQAFSDANIVANAQSTRALEQLMPTITAGIDAAGTSGSAVASLLTQKAADQAAATAAELSLNTAVQYGNIANQASGTAANLLSIEDPAMSQLLDALNIAKGARTSQTISTNSSETQNWNESTNSTTGSASSTRQSSSGTATSSGSAGGQGSASNNRVGAVTGGGVATMPTASIGGYNTPSSFSSGNRANPYVA